MERCGPRGAEWLWMASYKWRWPRESRLCTHYERNTKWSGKHRRFSVCAFHAFLHPFSLHPTETVPPIVAGLRSFAAQLLVRHVELQSLHQVRRGWRSGKHGNWWLLPLTCEKCEKIPETRFAKMRMRGVHSELWLFDPWRVRYVTYLRRNRKLILSD